MVENNGADDISVDEIMKMIKEENTNPQDEHQPPPSTKEKLSKIAPYEETTRVKAQHYINKNWHINIFTEESPLKSLKKSYKPDDDLQFLNNNYQLPLSLLPEKNPGVLGVLLNPLKRFLRKAIIGNVGRLFNNQEQFNSHLVRVLNKYSELVDQIEPAIEILGKQREFNKNMVSFSNQVNFREDVITIKTQRLEELIRELYRRMDNLYVVSNLVYVLEEKIKKLESELKQKQEPSNQH